METSMLLPDKKVWKLSNVISVSEERRENTLFYRIWMDFQVSNSSALKGYILSLQHYLQEVFQTLHFYPNLIFSLTSQKIETQKNITIKEELISPYVISNNDFQLQIPSRIVTRRKLIILAETIEPNSRRQLDCQVYHIPLFYKTPKILPTDFTCFNMLNSFSILNISLLPATNFSTLRVEGILDEEHYLQFYRTMIQMKKLFSDDE